MTPLSDENEGKLKERIEEVRVVREFIVLNLEEMFSKAG